MSTDTHQARLGELPCGHLADYLEAGECMRCDYRVNTPEERAVERELVDWASRGSR